MKWVNISQRRLNVTISSSPTLFFGSPLPFPLPFPHSIPSYTKVRFWATLFSPKYDAYVNLLTHHQITNTFRYFSCRARSLVVSDLRPETKGSQLDSGCQLCAEVSSPQLSPSQCLSAHEARGSGKVELNRYPPSSPAVQWIVNIRERNSR